MWFLRFGGVGLLSMSFQGTSKASVGGPAAADRSAHVLDILIQFALTEQGMAGDEHIGSSGDGERCGIDVDSAVYLKSVRQSFASPEEVEFADFAQRFRNQFLSAKPRFHRHHQYQIYLIDHVEHGL